MFKKKEMHCTGLKVALIAAMAVPTYAGIVIPSSQWGSGTGQVSDTVYNYSGPTICNLTSSVSTCTESIASNQPPGFLNSPNGTSSGTVSASVDSLGGHLYAEASGSGYSFTMVTGSVSFFDIVSNPTSNAAQIQLIFHLDATLFTRSSAVDRLSFNYGGPPLYVQLNYGGAGTYQTINQDFTTDFIAIPANSQASWSVSLSTTVGTNTDAASQYLAGLPMGYLDASNTVSVKAISVMDAQGNPLTSSGLTSSGGFNYAASSSSTTPEPATGALFASAAAVLALAGRRRLAIGRWARKQAKRAPIERT